MPASTVGCRFFNAKLTRKREEFSEVKVTGLTCRRNISTTSSSLARKLGSKTALIPV